MRRKTWCASEMRSVAAVADVKGGEGGGVPEAPRTVLTTGGEGGEGGGVPAAPRTVMSGGEGGGVPVAPRTVGAPRQAAY
jgi:hypothetical protein